MTSFVASGKNSFAAAGGTAAAAVPGAVPANEIIYLPHFGNVSFIPGTPVARHSAGVGVISAALTVAGAAIGVAAAAFPPNSAGPVQVAGLLVLADWTAVVGTMFLQAQSTYYLSATGLLSVTPPLTGISQQVGVALSQTVLIVAVQPPILL